MVARVRRGVLTAMLVSVAAGAPAAEPMPSQAQACVACHGNNGVSVNPEWPNLAGQHRDYLAQQLRAFRDGIRENAAMAPFVANLTEQDIGVLADYYADQKLAVSASGDAARVDEGHALAAYCASCHGMRGVPATKEWPILAGQHASYLNKQMLAFKHEERIHPLMQAALQRFGDAQFGALAAYYSQLKP